MPKSFEENLREEFVGLWEESKGKSTHEGEYIADWWLSKLQSYKEELIKEIEAYFKGLILIPDPQATKENIISVIKRK